MTTQIRTWLWRAQRQGEPVAVRGAPTNADSVAELRLPFQQADPLRPPVGVSYRPHSHLQSLGHGGVAHLVGTGLDGALGELQDADVGVGDVAHGALLPKPLAPQESLAVCQHSSPFAEGSRQGAEPGSPEGLLFGSDCRMLVIVRSQHPRLGRPLAALRFSRSLVHLQRALAHNPLILATI